MNHLHHHQQAAAYVSGGHHQLQDNQNSVQQQANFFNQYVTGHNYATPVTVYHNESAALSGHQHQANYHANYMANHHYNNHAQQQHHQVAHYQTTFGGHPASLAGQQYQEHYGGRCYAAGELARDTAEAGSLYSNSKFAHSDESENETTTSAVYGRPPSCASSKTEGGGNSKLDR